MKIGLAAPYNLNSLGGAERYTRCLAKALSQKHEVIVFTDQPPLDETGLSFLPLRDIKTEKLDLGLTQAIFGHLRLQAKIRLHIFHGTILGNLKARPWLLIHPRFLGWLKGEFQALKEKDGIICVSRKAQEEVRQMGFSGPIRILKSGGGFSTEKGLARRMDDGKIRMLFLGRFDDKVKRFPMMLKGFQKARKVCPMLYFFVAGTGSVPEADGLVPLGNLPREQALSWARRCDIQINASYYEGSSLSLAEGIFQGESFTLATPVGGSLEQIRHQDTGLFFHSAKDLSQKLIELCENPSLLEESRLSIQRNCPIPSWEEVASEVIRFAEEVLA